MIDWQLTAVTINCSAVAEEVTIIVKNDWSVKCTGFDKLNTSSQAKLCKGIQCHQIKEYVQKLQAEESKKNNSSGEDK